ncbi:glutamyl-tRNA reductase [Candidatus Marinamargulisbacteria bacterium SCGC AG-343-D04]|nr:glutamyl-tRNA reductase [Candidatus Marinamargulisbacteria bacterium SCGC AG-343-D04]
MNVGLLGVDHTQTDILSLEPIFLNKEGKTAFRNSVRDGSPLDECVILTTCNRIEFYYAASSKEEAETWIIERVAFQKKVDVSVVRNLLKSYSENVILQHLFEVASGVQSMVFGENEILTQVKEAYEHAYQDKTTGPLLNKIVQTAVAVGKRSRAETEISRGAYSVSSIAIDALRQKRLDYFGLSILIIGCGTMGRRCLKKLAALGHPDITLSNRTESVANEMAKEHEVSDISISEAVERCSEYDVVISAVAVREALLTKDVIPKDSKTLFIDLGLPRNIDPEASKSIITVEDLKLIADKSIKRRKGEEKKVMVIIDEEKERLNQWFSHKKAHAN